MKTLSDFCYQAEYFFVSNPTYDRDAVKKFLRRRELKVIFKLLVKDLEKVIGKKIAVSVKEQLSAKK